MDAKELKTKSGKTFGLIKSPSLEGPSFCSYTFIPAPDQRVEIQIYRILNIGKLNGTRLVKKKFFFNDITFLNKLGYFIEIKLHLKFFFC